MVICFGKFHSSFSVEFLSKLFRFPLQRSRGMKDYVTVFTHYILYFLFGIYKNFYYFCDIIYEKQDKLLKLIVDLHLKKKDSYVDFIFDNLNYK